MTSIPFQSILLWFNFSPGPWLTNGTRTFFLRFFLLPHIIFYSALALSTGPLKEKKQINCSELWLFYLLHS